MVERRRGAWLLAAAVALVVASAVVPGLAAAAPDDQGVTRDGTTVVVAINASHYDGTPGKVYVQVGGESRSKNLSFVRRTNGLLVYHVPLGQLGLPDGDLRSVNVSVTAENWNNSTWTAKFGDVNLQHLAFGPAEHAKFADGALWLDVSGKQTYGFAPGDSVELSVNGTGPVRARLSPNETWLVVETRALANAGALLQPITVDVTNASGVSRSAGGVTLDPRTVATTTVEPTGAGLRVGNPLLLDGGQYTVVVTAFEGGTPATYATNVTASAGALTVRQPALVRADTATVRIVQGGTPVDESAKKQVTSKRPEPAKASVTSGEPATFAGVGDVPDGARLWLAVGGDAPTRVVSLGSAYDASGGTVTLSGYRVAPNGSYRLAFVTDDGVRRANAPGSGPASLAVLQGGDGGDAGESPLPGPLSAVPTWLFVAVAVGAFLFVVVVGAAIRYRRGGSGGGSSGGTRQSRGPDASAAARRANTTPTHQVKVRLVDEVTGDRLSVDGRVDAVKRTRGGSQSSSRQSRARSGGSGRGGSGGRNVGASGGAGSDRAREELSRGQASFSLEPGTWRFEADVPGVAASSTREIRDDATVTLRADPGDAAVRVVDAAEGHPVGGVTVACEPDAGDRATDVTGDTGRASFDDVPASASQVRLSASHDRYADASKTVSVDDGGVTATVELEPLTGAAEVEVSVDGTPVGGVPVLLSAEDEFVADVRGSTFRATAGDDGVARFDGLMVGEYSASAGFEPANFYSGRPERVTVEDGGTARATYDASFTYRLSEAQKQRVTELLSEARALGESSGSDAVVPRYYGSVVESLLDAVERLPDRGDRFAAADVADPEAVADALLDAAESVLARVSTAMDSKRNGDLFAACSDLPDRQVAWSGRFDVDELFDLLEADRVESRRRLAERLESVDDQITDAQGELATLSPVREPWEELRELVREARGGDEVRTAATLFAADGMLDAVAAALDEPEVRKRLQRTVF